MLGSQVIHVQLAVTGVLIVIESLNEEVTPTITIEEQDE